jgi:nucleotidyltransferase/DNA polymerase involved in DNA repair
VAEARQRCPDLVVRLADVDGARRLQAEVAAAALAFTPLVASTPGHWIVDLRDTTSFWCERLRPGRLIRDAEQQAELIANDIYQRIHDDVGLSPLIGIGARPLVATIAARQARALVTRHARLVHIRAADEVRILDALPIQWLPIGSSLMDHLLFMHHRTIGDVRALGLVGLETIAGAAGVALHAQLIGNQQILPAALDAEPHCSAETLVAATPLDHRAVLTLIASLAQQVGTMLRRNHLAATKLSLTARWGTGCTRHAQLHTGYQVRDDRDLIHLAEQLVVRTDESSGRSCTWLRLSASGLCTAEAQQALFRLEDGAWDLAWARPTPALPVQARRVAEAPPWM